ncbi:MAG TPA: gamma-glutamyltransferase [Acidimicrobiales bacterium]
MVALAPFVTRYATNGMVCSVDHLASCAGVATMRAGGSAADAAIAASAVLAVTTQHMCGMGGDLFALVHTGGRDEPAVLNSSGRAGSGADPQRLRDEGHREIPRTGDVAAVPVPGCVDGWLALHERFGRLPLADVLEPARAYAADGFAVSPTLAISARRLFELGIAGADDYTGGRSALRPGDVVRRPGVARALEAVARDGRRGFYEGEFGEGLLAVGGGEYAEDDLRAPLADWVQGLAIDVWDRRVWTIPPNSQGYLTLASAWIASQLDLPTSPDDPVWAHLLVEASRQAAFDRPDVLHEHADGAPLIGAERLAPRAAAISRDGAARELAGTFGEGGTIYLCAADRRDGMAVSLIQSNYQGFGSLLVVPGVRIFLQNRGAGFSLQPGHPAEYGPGRRPPHTLSPAMVTMPDGSFDCVLGTMGGDSQPQVLLQLLARRYGPGGSSVGDAGRWGPGVGDAIAAPRFVLAGASPGLGVWDDGGRVTVAVDAHAPDAWFEGLAARGHEVVRLRPWSADAGHAHLIARSPDGSTLAGADDPRSLGGATAGW